MTQPSEFGPSLVAMFEASAARRGDAPFLWRKRGGVYGPQSWREVATAVDQCAAGLQALGLERGDRVFLVAENRPEWAIADLAIMRAGGVTVPAYTTNTTDDHDYLLEHCGARFVICSTPALAKRLRPAVEKASAVAACVMIDGEPTALRKDGAAALSFEDLRARGRDAGPPAPAALEKDDIACIIYTSGTGGRPKGVMLSHGNILANIRGAHGVIRDLPFDGVDRFLSFLPLSHSVEHTAGLYFPISLGAEIYYAESIDALSKNMVEAKPTIMICVPRLYEVMRQKISSALLRQGGLKAKLFARATKLGAKAYEARIYGKEPLTLFERLENLALDRLVRAKVGERFGGEIRALVSGGAPLNYDVGLFFTSLGLPVLQGYGQTESAPLISVNLLQKAKLDKVGPPVEGVEVAIAEDGEILARGELVMKGYWRDEAATAQTVVDGWLHTGDIGELDEDGYLAITDRKKDIIVNSGGDNIAPQRVEGVLCLEPEIEQAMVYGDKRPNLVALIAPSADCVESYAKEKGVDANLAQLAADPIFVGRVEEAIKRANQKLGQIEKVRKSFVVAEPFTVDNGMMTPTMKLRRNAIRERFGDILDGMYRSPVSSK